MIAAEQLGRNAYLMELDPRYVDVIVNRWEELTGKKAQLVEGGEDPVVIVKGEASDTEQVGA